MDLQAQDRRVKRTQKLLTQALIELILEKGFDATTIRDITERADVGYATFFRHYADKEALLHDVLDVVLTELINLLRPFPKNDPQRDGTLLFQYVQEHREVVHVILRSNNTASLIQRIMLVSAPNVLQEHAPRPASPVPMEIAIHHLVAASIHLIDWWLEHNMPYSPERMGTIYKELIVQPTQHIAFDDPPSHSNVNSPSRQRV